MTRFMEVLLPVKVDNTVRGAKLPVYVFTLIAVVSAVRSCLHLLTADGGAGSVAGLDLEVAGAQGIVFAFALWGSAQLITAVVQLLVIIRYQALVPFMYLLLIFEMLLRMLVGRTRSVTFAHTPPGAVGNWVLLPFAAMMLALSVWSAYRDTSGRE